MTDNDSGFLGLPKEKTRFETSAAVVIPAPFEKTTSYAKGCARGPQSIIEASHQVEFYDPELGIECWEPGIHTLSALSLEELSSEEALKKIEKETGKLLEAGKFPVLLGGEHTVSVGAIRAAAGRFPKLCVLQIDAHADLRDSYDGTPLSHACAMRRVVDSVQKLAGVGIRALCAEEAEFARENRKVDLFYDHERRKDPHWVEKALSCLSENVYVTVDVDGFDPAIMPSTGTPVPGGLSWEEGLLLLRKCFETKRIVACDVVELLPLPNAHAPNFLAAQLTYKLIGYHNTFRNK